MAVALTAMGDYARSNDSDEFMAALFLPAPVREQVFALIALRHQLASIKDKVSEPTLGLIRLQWWRERIGELAPAKSAPAHPVLVALQDVLVQNPVLMPYLFALVAAFESDFDESGADYHQRASAYWQARLALLGLPALINAEVTRDAIAADALRYRVLAGYSGNELAKETDQLLGALAGKLPAPEGGEQTRGLLRRAFLPRALTCLWLKSLAKNDYGIESPLLRHSHPWRSLVLVRAAYLG